MPYRRVHFLGLLNPAAPTLFKIFRRYAADVSYVMFPTCKLYDAKNAPGGGSYKKYSSQRVKMGVILEISNEVCGMGYLWNVTLCPQKSKIFGATRQQSSSIHCTSHESFGWGHTQTKCHSLISLVKIFIL